MVSSSRLAIVATFASVLEAARVGRKKQGDCYSKYDGMTLLKLNACSSVDETVAQLAEAGCYMLDEPRVQQLGCTDAEVVCSGEVAGLEKAGVASIVTDNAGAFWRQESGVTHAFTEGLGVASDFYSDWRDLAAIEARMKSAVDASSHATLEVAGKSLEGRNMYIVRVRGRGYSPDKNMTRVVLTFNLHAREWITVMAGVYAVEELLQKVEADYSYVDGTEVVLMPMANPDGFVYSTFGDRMHRKNMAVNAGSSCKGVDLNRNWDSHWAQGGSSTSPCSDVFHGSSPNSEPETKVIAKVMEEAPMTVFIDTHSYTELVLTSPAWTRSRSTRHNEYRSIGGAIQSAIRATHGKQYTEGPAAATLYVATGGTIDYADDRGAFGICLELRPPRWGGGGFAPNKSEIRPSAEETYQGILAAINYAKDPSSVPAPAPPPPPTGDGCEGKGGSGPDADGDCRCATGTNCYEDGSSGCTYTYTARYGWKSARWFLPTCSGCICQ